METKDTVALAFSLLSIVISVIAYRKADQGVRETNRLSARTLRQEALQKYVSVLLDSKQKFDGWFRVVEEQARLADSEIINRIDEFGVVAPNGRPLRHVANDIVELCFRAFRREMPWQSPMNLYPRIADILHLRHEVLQSKLGSGTKVFDKVLQQGEQNPERYLFEDSDFKSLVGVYDRCVTKEDALNAFAQTYSQRILKLILEKKTDIEHEIAKLDAVVAQNSLEEVSLNESVALQKELTDLRNTLICYQHFYLLESKLMDEYKANLKDQTILIVLIMRLLSRRADWGSSD